VAIGSDDIAREKDRLPRGWGRFGKSLERLADIAEPDESLLCTCVALNPDFEHRSMSMGGTLIEMTKDTNVVLGLTDRRLILVATGMGGGPRSDESIPIEGLEVAERKKKEFVLVWPGGSVRLRGAAKQMLPEFLDRLA
jgi:hypothetical protein